jgi:hypothetical protein
MFSSLARSHPVPRTLLWCAALAAFPSSSWADQTITSTETVVRLTVQPMPAPKPALRYLLLPELKEMNPGNPIPNYLKCLMDQDFSSDTEALGRSALRQADRAARLDKPDWQILLKVKSDGINLLLPDVQKLRTLAGALQGRFRDEVSLGHFDDALVTAKTMFAMSRHMGEHPTLIGGLVGIAIAFITVGSLDQMLEQPGCPNLYWALTNLPNPLISVDKGMEGERLFIVAEFPELADSAPLSAEQLKKLIAHIDKIREFDHKPAKQSTRAWLDARTKDEESVRAARRRLVEFGLPQEKVERFSADQVILVDDKRESEVRRDEVVKLMNLPMWQMEALACQIKPNKEPALFDLFTPAVMKVRRAQGRLEQRIALLRHVEALRLYAAAHDGKVPAKLSDVDVPLPADPFTGKPFRYTVEGATAHLHGSPPPGEEKNPAYNVHYEVTIQK